MRYTFLVLLFISSIYIPLFSYAQTENAGFVQGVWYAKDPAFADVPNRIYVALRNNTSDDLTGTVRFSDNGVRIGSSEFSALSGRLVEAWVDWTPKAGTHKIIATVTDATLHAIGGGTQSINISGATVEASTTIDLDTDGDGVGNATDTDDDNDHVSDTAEKERGTNPLVPNPTGETRKDEVEITQETAETQTSPQVTPTHGGGLEQFVDNNITHTLLQNATTKIESAKESLDTYRTARNEALANEVAKEKETVISGDTESDTATITRTQIGTKKTLLDSFITSVRNLLALGMTGLLWLLSAGLGYPALLECFLLLGILYMIYRIARRFGRRQRY